MSKDIYNNNGYKWLLASMAIAAPIYSSILLASSISSWLEISNVNYKYLIVEKSVLDALPVKKCEANEEYEKTCYKTNGVAKLHNIKALSTLGKFYYLETKDGEKFELDASKIISRKK
jgi:putative membrane protein